MSITLNSNIILECDEEAIIKLVIADNTFSNPVFKNNEIHGHSNWQTSPTIETYRYEQESLILPRGYMRLLIQIIKEHNITPHIIDKRTSCPCIYPDQLKGIVLRDYQQRAVEEALRYDQGVICAPTGSGKSLLGLEIIRKRQQKALIIVHRSDLAKQWARTIKEVLGLEAGFIGEGETIIGDLITIGMIQSLTKEGARALGSEFGLILTDEVHHCPAASYFEVLSRFSAKYRFGLSATLERRDGLEQMIYRATGSAIATISRKEVEGIGATVPAIVKVIDTGFVPYQISSWADYLTALATNADRNLQIIDLAKQQSAPCLILVDRVAHAEDLSSMMDLRKIEHVIAHGQLKDRDEVMDKIKGAEITIATTSLIGEGIDVTCWGSLIIASPISSETKLMQAIGRVIRSHPGKRQASVYDLKDDCGFSGASFKKRVEIYKKHKIWIEFGNKKAAQTAA